MLDPMDWLQKPPLVRLSRRTSRCVRRAEGRQARWFVRVLVAVSALVAMPCVAQAQTPTREYLLERIAALEEQLIELKRVVASDSAFETKPPQSEPPRSAQDPTLLDYLHDLKYGGSLDLYYGFNFNRPVGRVNLLRAYDVTSNNFSLNQASLLSEVLPDLEAGRRFGARSAIRSGH